MEFRGYENVQRNIDKAHSDPTEEYRITIDVDVHNNELREINNPSELASFLLKEVENFIYQEFNLEVDQDEDSSPVPECDVPEEVLSSEGLEKLLEQLNPLIEQLWDLDPKACIEIFGDLVDLSTLEKEVVLGAISEAIASRASVEGEEVFKEIMDKSILYLVASTSKLFD